MPVGANKQRIGRIREIMMTKTVNDIRDLSFLHGVNEWPGDLSLVGRQLTSLEGCPQKINGEFQCGNNPLENFVGGPRVVKTFNCSATGEFEAGTILNLDGMPQAETISISGQERLTNSDFGNHQDTRNIMMINCSSLDRVSNLPPKLFRLVLAECNLSSLGGLRCSIEPNFQIMGVSVLSLRSNKIKSLENVHAHFPRVNGMADFSENPIEEGWLHVFFIKGLTSVKFGDSIVDGIFNSHLHLGKAGLVKCQLMLMKYGYEKYVRL